MRRGRFLARKIPSLVADHPFAAFAEGKVNEHGHREVLHVCADVGELESDLAIGTDGKIDRASAFIFQHGGCACRMGLDEFVNGVLRTIQEGRILQHERSKASCINPHPLLRGLQRGSVNDGASKG